ncbi:MAG: HAMP domain-containing protein, partial [Gammaproteobacteria bacterium]|nr:HAMP domain-containing protein [Gammaproteobacteria bacterium]
MQLNQINILNHLNIGSRLVLLIAVQTVTVVIIGATALYGLNYARQTTQTLNTETIEQVTLNQLNEVLRADFLATVNDVHNGRISWEQGSANLLGARNLFVNNWAEYRADKPAADVQEIDEALGGEYQKVLAAMDDLDSILNAKETERLNDFVNNSVARQITPFLTELNDRVAEQQLESGELFKLMLNRGKNLLYGSALLVLFGLGLATTLGYFIFRSIVRPIKQIATTVNQVAQGDYYARTQVAGNDELGSLGFAFDNLLDDKVATLVQAEKENEQLNESVINLLQAVSKLSQRDLTVRVPVTEDVAGPVADALNQFTSETSKVLLGVRRIAEQVARATSVVKSQSDIVIAVSDKEHSDVVATLSALDIAVVTMNDIAQLADACSRAAENAIGSTHTALTTVTSTVDGINGIRTTIHETEKRLKRLGERSQE